ncbi:DUF1702 family protein [Nocardiopsis sp. RV163]|uniref:DUF1702 family protein n=1 Tax=Nocardiopsis sp. RV163 TaxID=1661388 RepID=UPI0009E28C8E|nr:DUF1702 family protein [Nocardiopsis sp. RV163]
MGSIRRRIITPDVSETKIETRGFHDKGPMGRRVLETVGESFLTGLGHAAETASPRLTGELLEELPTRYQGFAYEGAAMGFSLLDGLLPGGGRTRRFLEGPGADHVYMAYIGIGWAMARLPRPLWPTTRNLDPVLRWLVHDGYGFHQAYFHTDRYVRQGLRDDRAARRTGDGPYALRAADQGVGRALWFVGGTDPVRVADLVLTFDEERHADLWSGVGLAATYAGGADEEELRVLLDRAGGHRWEVAQGSAFAAEARVRAGLLVPHTEAASQVLCGTDARQAALLSRNLRPDRHAGEGPERPAYEVWRTALAEEFSRREGARP